MYLEPWHADIFDFLDLRKNHGKEEQRARDLFYALWIPDLFMRRVEEDGVWSLMCPHASPGLQDCWGEKFEALYTRYEKEGKFMRQVIFFLFMTNDSGIFDCYTSEQYSGTSKSNLVRISDI